MKYAILYSSNTGNTKMLADTLKKELSASDCIYWGNPSSKALDANRLYVGFWTDKGSCDSATAAFLQEIKNKEIFLFGTAGFGGEPAYYEKIIKQVSQHIDSSNTIIGTFMCQGKMPASVRIKYEEMKEKKAPIPNIDAMLENYEKALSHPDDMDLQNFINEVKKIN